MCASGNKAIEWGHPEPSEAHISQIPDMELLRVVFALGIQPFGLSMLCLHFSLLEYLFCVTVDWKLISF